MRDEIDHLYKLKQAFQLTKMKIKNTNQRKELDRIGRYLSIYLVKTNPSSADFPMLPESKPYNTWSKTILFTLTCMDGEKKKSATCLMPSTGWSKKKMIGVFLSSSRKRKDQSKNHQRAKVCMFDCHDWQRYPLQRRKKYFEADCQWVVRIEPHPFLGAGRPPKSLFGAELIE